MPAIPPPTSELKVLKAFSKIRFIHSHSKMGIGQSWGLLRFFELAY
uniref:Uncharacterized protein n=1 Tax=Anguilla anguilla TaxID=7936 RepID=A0A0E9QXI2_ANGAN